MADDLQIEGRADGGIHRWNQAAAQLDQSEPAGFPRCAGVGGGAGEGVGGPPEPDLQGSRDRFAPPRIGARAQERPQLPVLGEERALAVDLGEGIVGTRPITRKPGLRSGEQLPTRTLRILGGLQIRQQVVENEVGVTLTEVHRGKPRAQLHVVGPCSHGIAKDALGPEEVVFEKVGSSQEQNQPAVVGETLAGVLQIFDGSPRFPKGEQLGR